VKSVFEESISPIYRRIAQHAYVAQMLTDEPEIILQVRRIDYNAAGLWRSYRELFEQLAVIFSPENIFKDFHLHSGFEAWAMQQSQQTEPQNEPEGDSGDQLPWDDAGRRQQDAIDAARDALRKFCLEFFPKIEK
jgi:hypothetical protein